ARFDLEDVTYSGNQAGKLSEDRQIKIGEITKRLEAFDICLFQHFQSLATKTGREADVVALYRTYFQIVKECDEDYLLLLNTMARFSQSQNEEMDVPGAMRLIEAVKQHEPA